MSLTCGYEWRFAAGLSCCTLHIFALTACSPFFLTKKRQRRSLRKSSTILKTSPTNNASTRKDTANHNMSNADRNFAEEFFNNTTIDDLPFKIGSILFYSFVTYGLRFGSNLIIIAGQLPYINVYVGDLKKN